MKIKPLSDYIVVDTKEKAETTKSGFILPSASADKYVTATPWKWKLKSATLFFTLSARQ